MRFNGVWWPTRGQPPQWQADRARRLILCTLSLLVLWIGGTIVAGYLAPYLQTTDDRQTSEAHP